MKIPDEVKLILKKLEKAEFEAYIVGGCVRDLLLEIAPKDWDITTSAKPEEILKIFPDSFYENKFSTVGVKTDSDKDYLKIVEITTFRTEAKYTDKRHPDEVKFAKTLEEDLKRRDFTVNAMAVQLTNDQRLTTNDNSRRSSVVSCKLIDPFNGQSDLKNKLIRAVSDSGVRFSEDALRLMRGVRLATSLGFNIEEKTYEAIKNNAGLLKFVSKERVRDEFIKIIETEKPSIGLEILRETGLLEYVIPELGEGYGVGQNKHHVFTIWEHNLKSLDYGAKKNFPTIIRISALLHDVAKPHTKEGDGADSTFYSHDVVGAKMAARIMERLKFSHADIEKVYKLVRWHLFNYDPEKGITDSAIRRLVKNVGPENIEDLIKVRICDRIGSGVPKAVPYRLRHFEFRVEKILREQEAVSVKMLKANGDDVMKILNIAPGPRIGQILNALLEEVIDETEKNNREYLISRIKELNKLSDKELEELREKAESKTQLLEDQREAEIKEKFYVK